MNADSAGSKRMDGLSELAEANNEEDRLGERPSS